MKKQKDPLEEIRNANKGKEMEIREAIKEALDQPNHSAFGSVIEKVPFTRDKKVRNFQ